MDTEEDIVVELHGRLADIVEELADMGYKVYVEIRASYDEHTIVGPIDNDLIGFSVTNDSL